MSKPLIFSLRPEPDCSEDVASLTRAGYEARPLPMMAIKGDDAALDKALETFSHTPDTEIIITSKQSGRMLAAYSNSSVFRQSRIWCVGAGSAEILRQAGFTQVEVGKADAAELLEEIDASNVDKKPSLLWLSGADIAFDIEKGLNLRGHRATRIIIYQTVGYTPENQHPDSQHPENQALLDALFAGRPVAAIAMSARTITRFAEMLAYQKMPDGKMPDGKMPDGKMSAKSVNPILIVQSPAQAERAKNLGFSCICAEGLGRKALLACATAWAQRHR
jgi:uroporphyrinogen-III synthase